MIKSNEYWEKRYRSGGNSGSGSYGRLSKFKAEIINDFIKENNIKNIIEFGCGDGNQLGYIDCERYIGYDVSNTSINKCKEKFKLDKSKSFYNIEEYHNKILSELTISIDVIFHLIEDDVFEIYMNMLFSASSKYVIIYSSNGDINTKLSEHLKDRNFTDWVEKNINNFKLINKIDNKYKFDIKDPINTSISDFYIYQKK